MSHQTTMNNGRQKREQSPATGVRRNLAGLTHDLITLGELQCQLVAVDLRDAKTQSIIPIVMIAGGLLLAMGTMPVILLGIGWALVNLAGFTEGIAFLTVSLIALAIAAATAWWGWNKLNSALAIMKRSQHELSENVRWIKQSLLQHDTRSAIYRQRV
ncbi:MAG: phage holin family protein [Planctomycetaceae bacterium]|nr:phage holin family protein [Planctomycetaceae bacterium]